VNFFTTDPDEIALNALFDQVNRDPRMQAAYVSYLGKWRAATNTNNTLNNGIRINAPSVAPDGAMFHHFTNSDSWSPFGRWGAKEFPNQTSSPKFKGLTSYIVNRPMATVPGD
jgi:ADP-ribose pyrophosphatase YjhB (NUDIX family)